MQPEKTICTVITKNRLAYARTLAESFHKHEPQGICAVLVIDDFEGCIDPKQEAFEVLELCKLGLKNPDQLRFKYSPFELCCALKPFLLEHLLTQRQIGSVFYFDSDILILSPLEHLSVMFEDSDILLTPHLDRALPADGKLPDDGHVLLSGTFNGGFVGVKNSENGLSFLRWWKSKLQHGCIEDHFNGVFVDQKYLDLVFGLFERVRAVRHPGCNVAYWNLHSRKVTLENGKWFSNGKPLVFFHFSDYSLDHPDELSGHQNRYRLTDDPDLSSLFAQYRAGLLGNGYKQSIDWKYDYNYYSTGKKIPAGARRAFLANDAAWKMTDPFNSSTHPLSFKLASLWQSLRLLAIKLAHRFLRRPG